MKGIILAGGKATRLYPSTKITTKHLLPVYDKPMIYYPLSTLMLAGIREYLIITAPEYLPSIRVLLNEGHHLGIDISYKIQEAPKGIAEAFIIGEDFIGKDNVTLILGDNLFYGDGLAELLQKECRFDYNYYGALIFCYRVKDAQRYGVAEIDTFNNKVISIEEKPLEPKSNFAVTGLYCYTNNVVEIAKNLQPSLRGELEITDINKEYLKRGQLNSVILDRGYAWLDTGTHNSLLDASNFIQMVEERQGLKIGCIEEVAYRMNYISKQKLSALVDKSDYGEYLKGIVDE